MSNELERILGEVADGASRRAGALPVDALRGRGARRRRTRQASYGVVGVAAAFGLAFGAAQFLPDDGAVGPAVTPTSPLPTADTSLPLGACGSVVTNLPAIDGLVWLELTPTEVSAPAGQAPPVTVTVQNFDSEPLDLSGGDGPYLFAARDGVVVGFSWPSSLGHDTVPGNDEYPRDDFGPFVVCEQGELRPTGEATDRTPLPVGTYGVHTAITLRPDAERNSSEFNWAFDLVGREGTLTITDPETAPVVWPELVPGAKTGACGSGEAFPIFDTPIPLSLNLHDPFVAQGADVEIRATLTITDGRSRQDSVGDGPYLIAVRESVVVGYSWLREAPGPSTLDPGQHTWEGFGPFVLCNPGEERPAGNVDYRTALPPGEYGVWVAHSYEAPAGSVDWAFENIEHGGRLTITAPEADGIDPPSCEPITITQLLDGSPAGAPVETVGTAYDPQSLRWGPEGTSISQVWGEDSRTTIGEDPGAFDPASYPEEQVVAGLTGTHLIVPVGDFGVSEVQLRTLRDDCPTVIWLPAGTTLAEARAYAAEL